MSKFQEMCDAVGAARKYWSDYRDRSYANLHSLVEGFVQYCEIPEERVEYRPLDKEPEENKRYTRVGATHFGKDGYWHVGLVITLQPLQRVLIKLSLAEKAGKVMVKAGLDDTAREIDPSDKSQCRKFYDEIVEDIKRFYTAEPDFDDKGSLKTIGGFRSGS